MGFSRYLQVDPGGAGDYTTIQAAVNAAQAAGASNTARWWIDCAPADYSENVVLPGPGYHVRGRGPYASILKGTFDFHSGSSLEGFTVEVPTANAVSYGIRFIMDTANLRGVLNNVKVQAFGTNTGIVSALELTGSAQGGLLNAQNCYFYSANRYTGDNSSGSAQVVGVRLKSDYVMYAEIFNSHFKTSTGGGTPQPILVLNEAVAPSTNYGYVHIAGSDWEDVYGDGGTTPHPYFIKSANTVHEGAMLDIGYLNVFSTTEPTIQIAYTGPYTRSILYSRAVNYFKSSGTWP